MAAVQRASPNSQTGTPSRGRVAEWPVTDPVPHRRYGVKKTRRPSPTRRCARTYFIYRHVCDGGELGCSSRRIATTHRLYVRSDRQRNAPRSPRPSGLRPGRSPAALPSSTISTYGLRRAPCIRSVLATTHHAPIYEVGSGTGSGAGHSDRTRSAARRPPRSIPAATHQFAPPSAWRIEVEPLYACGP